MFARFSLLLLPLRTTDQIGSDGRGAKTRDHVSTSPLNDFAAGNERRKHRRGGRKSDPRHESTSSEGVRVSVRGEEDGGDGSGDHGAAAAAADACHTWLQE